jgi:hypothetical protein
MDTHTFIENTKRDWHVRLCPIYAAKLIEAHPDLPKNHYKLEKLFGDIRNRAQGIGDYKVEKLSL